VQREKEREGEREKERERERERHHASSRYTHISLSIYISTLRRHKVLCAREQWAAIQMASGRASAARVDAVVMRIVSELA